MGRMVMKPPLRLDRLPKAARLRSIQFKRTTPGTFKRLIAPSTERRWYNIEREVLDPSHPWARQPSHQYFRKLPCFRNNLLTMYLYPKALLGHPPRPWPENKEFAYAPPTIYDAQDGRVVGGKKKLNMSMMFIIGKRKVHKFSVVRTRIRRKVKNAVGLIVTRDASVVKNEKGKEVVVSGGSDDGEKWILQDWTYVLRPSLEFYRMPLPALISNLRQALKYVNTGGRKLDQLWNASRPAHSVGAPDSQQLQKHQRGESLSISPESRPPPPHQIPFGEALEPEKQTPEEKEAVRKRSWANSIATFGALLKPFLKEHKAKAIDPILDEDDLLPSKREPENVEVEEKVKESSPMERMYSRKPILKIPDEQRVGKKQGRKR